MYNSYMDYTFIKELLLLNYKKLKAKQEEELNSFSKSNIIVILEFTKEKALAKLEAEGLTVEDVVDLGAGLYLKKEAVPEYNELIKKHNKEFHEYFFNNVYEVIKYEAANYEMEISLSYSYDEFLNIIGLSDEEITDNKVEINKAITDYKKEFYELN